jgi:hypothetical protein
MFCDACGNSVNPGDGFCGRCGKAVVGPVGVGPRANRVQSHLQLLGILWLAVSAFNTIGGIFLYILANTLFAHLQEMGAPSAAAGFLRPLLSVIAIIVFAKGAAGFITGWGLLQHELWARTLALVLGFLSLFNIPFGTAVGVYTLWVLLPMRAHREYESLVGERVAA